MRVPLPAPPSERFIDPGDTPEIIQAKKERAKQSPVSQGRQANVAS